MKLNKMILAMCMATSWLTVSRAQTARSYYEELYKAGGLDKRADLYVCFADEADNQNFFIFAKSDVVLRTLKQSGEFNKVSKSAQAELLKGFLNARGYNKGIPFSEEDFYSKDGNSWVTDKFSLDPKTPGRMRLDIAWATLRYKRSVEILNTNGSIKKVVPGYGRCELIPSNILQTAD